jgi:hypothetical protein
MIKAENKSINIKDISLDLSKRYNKYFDHRSHLKFINKDQAEILLSERTGHVLNDLRNRFALKILYPESSQPSFTDEELELNIDQIKIRRMHHIYWELQDGLLCRL